MRLIPGKTKVKIELFRGITIGDIIVGIVTVVLIGLVLMSTIPGRIYVAAGILAVGGLLVFRMDEQPNYMLVLGLLRYLAYPRRFRRGVTDKEILSKVKNKDISDIKDENDRTRVVWAEQPEKTAVSAGKKSSDKKILDMKDIIPFTSIADGFIGYDGKYYGTVIEIDPVEFRFFSKYRRDASIENCLGKVIRSLKPDYSANVVKIDRPILYDSYLDKEYDKLDALKKSYEKAFLYTENDGNDLSYFIQYHLDVMKKAFGELKKYLQRKIDEQQNILRFAGAANINERQRYVIRTISESKRILFTPKELATQFDISTRTARTDLQELVEMGYLNTTNLNKRAIGYIKSERFESLLNNLIKKDKGN